MVVHSTVYPFVIDLFLAVRKASLYMRIFSITLLPLTISQLVSARTRVSVGDAIYMHTAIRDPSRQSIKRGMIRYLYLAIDLSKTMSEGDMRPSRLAVTLRIVQDFVTNYFDQNPLSQLGILVTR